MIQYGKCRYDLTLQPVSGKAIPLYPGEVLRIMQVEGEQCVDFNCFSLHDYKERMSASHMREQGFRPKEGHIVVSAPPRYRPMMAILHMDETCVTDLLGPRCDAVDGEREFGLVPRTNCQDTFAEAIREYGLTPDDVHYPLNLWMHTIWEDGYYPIQNTGPKGDYVDLLALMEVLAVPIICGSGDIGPISNYSLKPMEVQVYEASDDSRAVMRKYLDRCTGLKNQRSRQDFRINEIRKARGLKRIPGYQPKFRAYPIVETEIDVSFSTTELKAIRAMLGGAGRTDEEIVRTAVMLWYQSNRMRQHWIRPDGLCCVPQAARPRTS